jgi:hypothetical protein
MRRSCLPSVRLFTLAAVALFVVLAPFGSAADKVVVPLRNAHAHNDYEHARPLFDALDHGFCSVEADVFLVDGKLLVGHTATDLRQNRTLEALYLDPLRERVRANGGEVYAGGPPFYLLIDVKTEARLTYAGVHDVLARYAGFLTTVDNGTAERKAVTVVISGNIAREAITAQPRRFAGIDGRAADLDSDLPAHLMPWVSDNWTKLHRWKGDEPMPADERAKLREFVSKAHAHGRLVRFWATAEKTAVWEELRAAGVDLINTDKLDDLQRFLLNATPARQNP